MTMSHLYHSYSLVDLTQGRGPWPKFTMDSARPANLWWGPDGSIEWDLRIKMGNFSKIVFNQSMITYMKLFAIRAIFSLWSLKLDGAIAWVSLWKSESWQVWDQPPHEVRGLGVSLQYNLWLYVSSMALLQSQLMSSEKKIICVLSF